MSAATLPRLPDASRPRSADGLGLGAVLALLVHLLLVAALAVSVNWRAHEPESVTAELWSAVPQMAAPRAANPPPAPPEPMRPAPVAKIVPAAPPVPDAQIAIEKARREEAKRDAAANEAQRRQDDLRQAQQEAQRQAAQRQKALRDKALADDAHRKQEAAEKARADEAALEAQRVANLKRILGQANATGEPGSTGAAVRSSGPSASYAGQIRAAIKGYIYFPNKEIGNPVAKVEVRCAPDGTIVSRKLVTSSGNAGWDEAVLRAIDKTGKLPPDVDGRVPPVFAISFRPLD